MVLDLLEVLGLLLPRGEDEDVPVLELQQGPGLLEDSLCRVVVLHLVFIRHEENSSESLDHGVWGEMVEEPLVELNYFGVVIGAEEKSESKTVYL